MSSSWRWTYFPSPIYTKPHTTIPTYVMEQRVVLRIRSTCTQLLGFLTMVKQFIPYTSPCCVFHPPNSQAEVSRHWRLPPSSDLHCLLRPPPPWTYTLSRFTHTQVAQAYSFKWNNHPHTYTLGCHWSFQPTHYPCFLCAIYHPRVAPGALTLIDLPHPPREMWTLGTHPDSAWVTPNVGSLVGLRDQKIQWWSYKFYFQ